MGLDDLLHPTGIRVLKEQLDVDAALLTACLQSFQNGVEADPIPVLQVAVGAYRIDVSTYIDDDHTSILLEDDGVGDIDDGQNFAQ